MAHQDIKKTPTKDLPPAYPYNDKPPDYHDVCPHTSISPPSVDTPPPVDVPPPVDIPPSVDVPPPDNIPTFNIPSPDSIPNIGIPPSGNIPTAITIAFNGSQPFMVFNNTTTTTTTTCTYNHSQENVIVTEPPNHASSSRNTDESQDQDEIYQRDILWKILIVLSVVACIIIPIIGIHACLHACKGYHSKKPETQKSSAKLAIFMCALSYIIVIILAIVLPATLA